MLFFSLFFCCIFAESGRIRSSFNKDWLFALTNDTEAYRVDFDDKNWRQLNVPHDWSIESNFSNSFPAGVNGGALPGGIGWYRKRFTVAKEVVGKRIYVHFDGVYRNSKVYVNGNLVGFRPYGYISFRYDITSFVKYDSVNVIAVQVDNSQQPNSRWYSGSGIYRFFLNKLNYIFYIFRSVHLIETESVHIDQYGTYFYSNKEDININNSANIHFEITVRNNNNNEQSVQVRTILVGPSGAALGIIETDPLTIPANSTNTLKKTTTIKSPQLWSTDNPVLYKAVNEIIINNVVVDTLNTSFGIRFFEFDSDHGFFLNGKSLKVYGVCDHHDLGFLGAAVNRRALERQVELLKGMGINGIRTSHNPPSPQLLEICDREGVLVMDEAFDMWRIGKTGHDYHLNFNEWHERDLSDQVKRDRNHASVFMWSIGNEVPEQGNHGEAGNAENEKLTLELANIVRNLDKTRKITAACSSADKYNHLFVPGGLDVLGFNYNLGAVQNFKSNYPGKKLILTEVTSAFQTRGYYQMPSSQIWTGRAND
jgi:beta-galactosidase